MYFLSAFFPQLLLPTPLITLALLLLLFITNPNSLNPPTFPLCWRFISRDVIGPVAWPHSLMLCVGFCFHLSGGVLKRNWNLCGVCSIFLYISFSLPNSFSLCIPCESFYLCFPLLFRFLWTRCISFCVSSWHRSGFLFGPMLLSSAYPLCTSTHLLYNLPNRIWSHHICVWILISGEYERGMSCVSISFVSMVNSNSTLI